VSAEPKLLAALALGLAVSACTPYLERRETVSFHAGDAVAANRAIHTIDPWPAAASRTDIPHSGRKIADAIERYHLPPKSAGGPPPILLAPLGAPPPP
jgi:hypothetical protein